MSEWLKAKFVPQMLVGTNTFFEGRNSVNENYASKPVNISERSCDRGEADSGISERQPGLSPWVTWYNILDTHPVSLWILLGRRSLFYNKIHFILGLKKLLKNDIYVIPESSFF